MRLLLLQGQRDEAKALLDQSKLYMPQLLDTQLLEAGLLLDEAHATVAVMGRDDA